LSPVEQQVYHFLLDFLAENTFQPSVRDIAGRFRIPSTKSVADLLASLERKGYVRRKPGRSRGVVLIGVAGGAGTMPVPVVRVAAGSAELITEDHLALDRRLVPASDAFLVHANTGDALAHGVRAGDLVMVNPVQRAKDGDVVVTRIGGAVLVRALQRRGATIVLLAPGSGEDLELGAGDDYVVLGTLAGVIRAQDATVG
jgi:repressor LexA